METINYISYIAWVVFKVAVSLVLLGVASYFVITLLRIAIEDILLDKKLLKVMREHRHVIKQVANGVAKDDKNDTQ